MSQLRTNSIVPVGGIPAGASGGGIIQCVSTTKTDAFTSTSSSFVDITGMSVSITPRSTSNKIYIIVSVHLSGETWDGGQMFINLVRNSTNISQGGSGSSVNATGMYNGWANNTGNTYGNIGPVSINFIDSPSTTSGTTYKIQGRIITAGYSWHVNRIATGTAFGVSSSITAMEISG